MSGELAAEGVTATFGFFGDRLSVGGTQAVPNVIISASGEISSSGFFVDSLGNVTASNMKLQDTLESEAVVSNFGFFGDSLEVGGSRGNPNVLISGSGVVSSSNFFIDELGNVTASNMKLQNELEAESVVSNFGFFGDSLEVGGSRGEPNVLISGSGIISSSGFFVDADGNVTASNMKLQNELSAESVVSNFGFFGNKLEIGGEKDAARIKIGKLLDHEDDDGNAKFGIMGFTGNSGSAGVDTVFRLGEEGNEIAGWTMTTSSISNGQVELSSALPGLTIDNEFGRETVMIASGSSIDTAGGNNEVSNQSFETGTTNNSGVEPRGGQNIGSMPNNWIFHSGSVSGIGTAVSQSLTNRTNYTTNTAFAGNKTFDIFVEESDFDTIKPLSYSCLLYTSDAADE